MLCITGNGLKTTDVLTGVYQEERAIAPKLAEFEKNLRQTLDLAESGKRSSRHGGRVTRRGSCGACRCDDRHSCPSRSSDSSTGF